MCVSFIAAPCAGHLASTLVRSSRSRFLSPHLVLFVPRNRPRWLAPATRPSPMRLCSAASTPSPAAGARSSSVDAQAADTEMFETGASFSALGASAETAERLANSGIVTPTRAQAAVVPRVLEGLLRMIDYGQEVREARAQFSEREVVEGPDMEGQSLLVGDEAFEVPDPPSNDVDDVLMLGAETGSGKTLAYLLPYIEALAMRPGYPAKAIVLVPSRELCEQVLRQLRSYFPNAPPHLVLSGGRPPDVADIKSVRILIATPASLLHWFRFSDKIDGNDKYIVVDEADMLLSGSFRKEVEKVLNQPGMKPFATRKNGRERAINRNRLVFVGATYPHWTGEKVKSIVTWMKQKYPAIASVQTEAIHRRSAGISDQWYYLPSPEERMSALLRILRDECKDGEKVMIFCGQALTAELLFDELAAHFESHTPGKFGRVVRLHKNVPAVEREEALAAFREGNSRLLVCTDLASRGLDLGSVTRVVEYEFSTNVVGYLHRIGRTARAGASGMTNHFYDDTTRALADAIRERSVDNIPVVEGVFSRDRSFRRKLRKKRNQVDVLV